eukprot:509707-Ditylum_brightwellii.AAC.2
MAKKDPLSIVVQDGFGTESLYEPPPEQDADGSDDVSVVMPEEESQQGEEDDALSLPSIPSIQDAKICHATDNFDPTDTNNSTARETIIDNMAVGESAQ